MKSVWLLHHVHKFADGHEDVKLIGVFESASSAEQALRQVADQPGFRDSPAGFSIDEHSLGLVDWQEGYVSV